MTINGEEAFISRGEIDYYSVRTLDTISFEQIPAILSLTVTPTVSADDAHVTMKVEVTDDKTKTAKQTETEEGQTEVPTGQNYKENYEHPDCQDRGYGGYRRHLPETGANLGDGNPLSHGHPPSGMAFQGRA